MPSVPSLPGISAYKMDIQQGNYVTQDMVAKLKPGMTRSQVRFILGTPLVVDMFRTNRWDYVYVYQKRGKVTEHRKFTVIFENDKLSSVEGDVVPAGGSEAAKGAATAEKSKSGIDSPAKPGQSAAPAKVETGAASPGEPVTTEASKVETSKPEGAAEKSKEEKPKEEKGFFGRMLDKIGL